MRPAEAVANLASVKLITRVEVVVDHDHVAGEHGSGRGGQDGFLDIDSFAQAQVAETAQEIKPPGTVIANVVAKIRLGAPQAAEGVHADAAGRQTRRGGDLRELGTAVQVKKGP